MTRVLIVDDKESNLYYLQVVLRANGYEVDVARHGAEALVLARHDPPDIVVSDLLMPVMDGYTLLRHWKADTTLRTVPFVVYTATYTDVEDERLAMDLGADAFILKPAEPEDFLGRLREVEARGPSQGPTTPDEQVTDERELLKTYSQTLIRKLEEKSLQLEQSNEALQRDNAERKRVEVALRASESEIRLLIESIPQIVWIAGPDGARIDVNQRWIDYTGLTFEASLGAGWYQAVDPEHRELEAATWRRSIETGEPFEAEVRLRRVDGAYHWMLSRALPMRDQTGAVVKWFGTCTDIHELKQAQARISEQARLLDQTQDAIVVQSLDGRVRYWNKGAERIHGWTAEEALGRSVRELHCPDVGQLAAVHDVLLDRGEWSGELRLVDRAGAEIVAECRWTLLPDTDGDDRTILTVNTDVTERRKIETQFLQAQRLDSIGTLAGGIAHDLNNLLSPIVMGAALLRMGDHDPSTLEVLDTMEVSARRGTDLARQVLSFARGIEGERAAVNLAGVIAEVKSIASTTFPKNISINVDAPPNLWEVIGDATQLTQVLLNLCVNARDAMPDGGHLDITARNAEAHEPLVRAHGPSAGRNVVLQVHDDGCGMPPDLIDRIFEPFLTTKAVGEGTGLGLSTVNSIVKSHGGSVEVTSRVGTGSTFEVRLPARDIPDRPSIESAETDSHRGSGETVLVVDDEVAIRELTRQTLETHGYRVLTAVDGADAVDLYRQRGADISVVLTDTLMPRLGGVALVRALRELDPDVAVIATSGVLASGGDEYLEAGAVEFLPKPCPTDQLLDLVRAVLDRQPG